MKLCTIPQHCCMNTWQQSLKGTVWRIYLYRIWNIIRIFMRNYLSAKTWIISGPEESWMTPFFFLLCVSWEETRPLRGAPCAKGVTKGWFKSAASPPTSLHYSYSFYRFQNKGSKAPSRPKKRNWYHSILHTGPLKWLNTRKAYTTRGNKVLKCRDTEECLYLFCTGLVANVISFMQTDNGHFAFFNSPLSVSACLTETETLRTIFF